MLDCKSPYDILFEPVQIGPVITPNRFYAAPHATGHGWNQPNGAIALRGMKAEGGWGTVAVQITEISPDTDMANHPMERIWDDSDIPRHAAQVAAIKRHGSLAAIELGHGGMRARNITTGHPVIGPSALPVLRPEVPVQTRAMDLADIWSFRAAHKAAAKRAVAAGYDILYVYAAHDISLLSNFLSLRTNDRTDEYGGSLENRLRLLREVLEDTLDVAAGEKAVALRFGVDEPGEAIGLRSDGEGRDVVAALAELPDLWDVNISGWPYDSATARFAEEGFQLPFTDFVKTVTSKPVVGVGRFTSPDLMVSLIKSGRLDLIGAARPSIADPFLPAKIRDGRIEEIRECIGCNICVSMDGYGLPVRCTQNPTVSEEWRNEWHPETVPSCAHPQHHLVVGAGPAGLECAWTLLRAGHQVTIAEADSEAGGRARRESALPGMSSWLRVADYRLHQIKQHPNANLYLSSPMTAQEIADVGADQIVLATGASWRRDGVGSCQKRPMSAGELSVLTPDDVMDGTIAAMPATTVIIYDDDHFYMASLVAEAAAQAGHKVYYVTPLGQVATWTDYTLEQTRIIDRLNALGVDMRVNLRHVGESAFVDEINGNRITLDATHMVLVGARQSRNELAMAVRALMPSDSVHVAGDALVAGMMQAAVLSGHQTARNILAGDMAIAPTKRDQVTDLA